MRRRARTSVPGCGYRAPMRTRAASVPRSMFCHAPQRWRWVSTSVRFRVCRSETCHQRARTTSSAPAGPEGVGHAVATVTAFGSADSHDEHYFTHPDQMIRGAVDDPTLTLDNLGDRPAPRHRVPAAAIPPGRNCLRSNPRHSRILFAVLGTVLDFKNPKKRAEPRRPRGMALRENEAGLKVEVAAWLPSEIAGTLSPADPQQDSSRALSSR